MAQPRAYNSPAQRKRRERILDVTQSIIEQEGLGSVRMNRIAEEAGVSAKTLYNIYESRDQLLLQVATHMLDNLQRQPVEAAVPGIPQLIALTENTMGQFRRAPGFMRDVLSIVILSEADDEVTHRRFKRIREAAQAALSIAQERGELCADIELDDVADLIAANQWGLALLWVRGLLELDAFARLAVENHCLTLLAVCTGERKTWLQARLREIQQEGRKAQGVAHQLRAVPGNDGLPS